MLIKGTFLFVLCSSNNLNFPGNLNTENNQLYKLFDMCTQIDFYCDKHLLTEYIDEPLFREKIPHIQVMSSIQ